MKRKLYSFAHYIWKQHNKRFGLSVENAVAQVSDEIPCFVVSYNNHVYVEQMVAQCNARQLTPIILDNASSDPDTQSSLARMHQSTAYVIKLERNLRHKVGFRPGIYEAMPEKFAYSDPDIKFSADMPQNFLDILFDLTDEYDVFKAGLALDLSVGRFNDEMVRHMYNHKTIPFEASYSIPDFEQAHWRFPLKNKAGRDVYFAAIDTTFAVYNKKRYRGAFMDGVRVAGSFSAIHLPWFPDLDPMNKAEKEKYLNLSKSSSWKN